MLSKTYAEGERPCRGSTSSTSNKDFCHRRSYQVCHDDNSYLFFFSSGLGTSRGSLGPPPTGNLIELMLETKKMQTGRSGNNVREKVNVGGKAKEREREKEKNLEGIADGEEVG